ncbi:MAG: peptidylprolyl isomerase [Candidatus Aminicenantes bacterium]|nr:peptidylprolyl isomerase [Candidatus Aminicenantes bacterium]
MTRQLLTLLFLAAFAASLSASAEAANPKVLIKTNKGDITLELYPDKAPVTVQNFLSYMDEKFYDGLIFHRVIKGFMIQGGGLNAELATRPAKAPIKNEAGNGLKNARGTIAMARSGEIHSATCQFFINHADNAFLDHRDETAQGFGYCVFGKVVSGLDVVDAIATAPTMTVHGMKDVPRETVTIISIRRVEN